MSTNTWLTAEYTQELQKLIMEVVNDPSTYMGAKYLPSVSLPVNEVFTEVIEASGGITNEHVIGTDPKYIQSFGTRVQNFTPPKYKEAIHYDEQKLLFLRKLGDNGRNVRGIRQYINQDIDRLNRRVEARIELERWNAIFNGGFSYFGKTFSYGIPASLRAVPIGAVWSVDGINANNSANPVTDMRYWLLGGYAPFRKYKYAKMVMNPNTVRWILDNTNVQSLIKTYFSAENFGAYELNKTLQVLIPGLPEVVIYDGWYQTESVNADGKLIVSDAIYFVPDGYIFFVQQNLPGGDKLGEFQQTLHLSDGTIDSPGQGKFLIIDDKTVENKKNPYLDLIGGVYGGVNLQRAFDLSTAKVVN